MRRREFLGALGGAAATLPFAVRTQPAEMPVIGFLGFGSPGPLRDQIAAFHQGLKGGGYIEGQNVAIEYRWADSRYDPLPALAAELVSRQVAVIVAAGGPAASTVKRATTTIPIVFLVGVDPVTSGLVARIDRPEGNATGMSVISPELDAKKLELIRELLPKVASVAVLLHADNPSNEVFTSSLKTAGRALGQQILVVNVSTGRDLDEAMANIQRDADALVVIDHPFMTGHRDKLVALAASHRIITIYPWREFPEAGGLLSYGTSLVDAFRQVGVYAGRILKGAKPADLPVLLPTKFELTINLKTAKTLGFDLPSTVLARADKVIE
jgi:putative ABC transport system substrate-binding protein